MRMIHWLTVACTLLLFAACDAGEFTSPSMSVDTNLPALTSVPGVTEVVDGVGPGASFALLKPSDWEEGTRELVVYTHGYVQPFLDPALPTELDGFRDWLLTQGIAVAYSSYSHTGYSVKDGAQRSHQLRGLFTDTFGEPDVVHLVGVSMGAMVASYLEERFPAQYDGALLLCGVTAGGLNNAQYIAHARVLWDAFFPGTLQGSLFESPLGYYVIPPDDMTGYPGSAAFQAIAGTILTQPARAAMLAGVMPLDMPINVADPAELVASFANVLGYQINGANALTDQLHGHSFFDNLDTRYAGSGDDDALNAAVARYDADPDAVNFLEHWYTPTGRIDDPVVALHTTRDPLVPSRGEALYAQRVAEAGNASLLTRLPPADRFGHCTFEPAEVVGAFLTLRSQVFAP